MTLDPQLVEFIKIVAAMLATFFAAFANSRRQIGKVRKEHQSREVSAAQQFISQQKAIDDRQSEVMAKYILLADQFKLMADEEKERSARLEKALEASRDRLLQVQENSDLVTQNITKALQGLTVALDGLTAQTKAYHDNLPTALAASVSDIAKTNMAGYRAGMSEVKTELGGKMDDILQDLSAKMDARNEVNGAAFKALEAGLTNLKQEVVKLAAATSADHQKIRTDLLAKIDQLVAQVAALSVISKTPGSGEGV